MSNFINTHHYVYEINDLSNQKKYIGVRTCHCATIQADPYMGSSTDVKFKQLLKNNPRRFHKKILKVCNSRREANLLEIDLHNHFNVGESSKFYNKAKSTYTNFDTTGVIQSVEQRRKNGIKHKDLIPVVDSNGNTLKVHRNDDRIKSGELVSMFKGTVNVVNPSDGDNVVFNVRVDDPRYLSGELKYFLHNKITVKDSNGNTFKVNKDDPRYLSGELVGHTKGKVTVKDKNGNTSSVSVDDPRYLSGELVHNLKGVNLGKAANSWKGYWCFNELRFDTKKDMSAALFNKAPNKCTIDNELIISSRSYKLSSWLNTNYDNSIIGITWKELGFYFLSK